MGIPTLITTNTHAVGSSTTTSTFTSGIDSTYDEYMFVFTDINPDTNNAIFRFQVNVAGQSGYNEVITSTFFQTGMSEAGTLTTVSYDTGGDQAQGSADQYLSGGIANDADASAAGILHLFSPSDTTYVKHFYSRSNTYNISIGGSGNATYDVYVAGYINVTGAVDEVQFDTNNGDFSGVIQMYGIS